MVREEEKEATKKVVQEVSGWLRVYNDGSVDRTWTGPPEVRFMCERVPPHDNFVEGVAVKDVVADETSGLRVRIYLPELPGPVKKIPIILHFHGGGFCISQADWYMYYNIYTKLCRSLNAIVVSVYQRLSPEHRLPAAIHDGFSALLWLRSVAKSDDVKQLIGYADADFERVFLIGDSSGGNIVHHVAAMAGSSESESDMMTPLKVVGLIPIHPGFVRAARSKSELTQLAHESPFLTLDMVDQFLGLALPLGSTKDHPYTCPMSTELERLRMPPVLMCVAENDLILETEMEYYEAMKEAKHEVELLVSNGMTHSFYLNKIAVDLDPETAAETDRLIAGIKSFVESH